MRIERIDIRNFRRLEEVRAGIEERETIFVGPNNSGKTSATAVFKCFLGQQKFRIYDFSVARIADIDAFGAEAEGATLPTIELDVWFKVDPDTIEFGRAFTLLPNLSDNFDRLGVRLRYAVSAPPKLLAAYHAAYPQNGGEPRAKRLSEFLASEGTLSRHFEITYASLEECEGDVVTSALDRDEGRNLLQNLVRIDFVEAQRGIDDEQGHRSNRLSSAFAGYYQKNLERAEVAEEAHRVIDANNQQLTEHYAQQFSGLMEVIKGLGVPSVNDRDLRIVSTLSPENALRGSTDLLYVDSDRSHSGRPLYKSGIEQMLGNPFYCGIIRVQRSGETFKGAHEPIITTAIFDRVQDIKSGKKVKKFTRHNHLYRGLFRCQHCDRSLVGELHKGRVYYRCQTAQCDTQSVREDRVSEAVSAILAQLSMTTDDLAIALKRLPAQLKQENHGNELAAIELQREQVAARIERLTDMMLDGLIDGHAFQAKKQALLIEQRRVDEQLALTALNTVSEARVHRFLELATNLAQLYDSAAKPEKRRIVEWATLNRTATGKSVCFEPSKWLTGTKTMLAALSCADVRDDSRTDDLDLANLVRSAEKAMRSDPQLAD